MPRGYARFVDRSNAGRRHRGGGLFHAATEPPANAPDRVTDTMSDINKPRCLPWNSPLGFAL
jgi:hypothetical protein